MENYLKVIYEVLEKSDTSCLCTFHVHVAFAGFDVRTEYTTRYTIDDLEISWVLEKAENITTMTGRWALQETDDGECIADYEAEVETSLAVPPEVQAMFVEESLPKLMEQFRDRAEEL